MKDVPLYDPSFVTALFNEMAATYGIVNLLSSFGFTLMWRRKCANAVSVEPNSVVLDLMTGMGELCTSIAKSLGPDGKLIALDLSPVMCQQARKHTFQSQYSVIEADALSCPLEDASVDFVFSSFGLKTFDDDQLAILAAEVARVLRPGGQLSFLEVSVPPSMFLRLPYMLYLNRVVPTLGRLLLGNPDNYKLLGVYTTAFGDCESTAKLFEGNGLNVDVTTHFFGCATGLVGVKPK